MGSFKVGIIGYGFSAKTFHIPFINHVDDLHLAAIVQRSPKDGNDAEKDHPGVRGYRAVDDMLADDAEVGVDVVVVTTSPEEHFALVKRALEAGKHVVVEKPFTPTSKEAEELVDLSNLNKKILTVYQNRRWDADFVTLSKYINDGSLGRIVDFESHFDRHRPQAPNPESSWKYQVMPGGGVIYDLGTHLIDQIVHLFGPPKRITAFIGSQRKPNPSGFEDSCTVHMHYSDGMMATARASVVSPEVEQLRFWVRGDKGSFKKFHLDCQEEQLKAGMRPGDSDYGVENEERWGVLTTVPAGSAEMTSQKVPTVEPPTWTEFYRRLGQALAGDFGAIPVDATGAATVIRLIELAKESSTSGRTIDV